jgi:transcriptional regulator with XRE-family HTH domain
MELTHWTGLPPWATVQRMARPSDPQPALAQAIRQLRHDRKLTQEDLAHASHLTVTALVRIEGARANPTWATVRRIAGALGVSVGELADLADRLANSSGNEELP